MAKHKRQNRNDVRRRSSKKLLQSSKQAHQGSSAKKAEHENNSAKKLQPRPTIPFQRGDKILLLGEGRLTELPNWRNFKPTTKLVVHIGDFSFAHSLLQHYAENFDNLTATTFESRGSLLEKYPQAEGHIEALIATHQDTPNVALIPDGDEESAQLEDGALSTGEPMRANMSEVLYGIDATKLTRYKTITRCKWDRIVFNFPHVGGRSTDVNRQVRFNQGNGPRASLASYSHIPILSNLRALYEELLSGFLHCAIHLLTTPSSTTPSGGTVLITIFEGEPYTLWNIRDLARDAGFAVVRSFNFDASAYPGYQHARTFGNTITKNESKNEPFSLDGEDQVKVLKWRGAERPSRTYEFGLKDAVVHSSRHDIGSADVAGKNTRKRKRRTNSSSSENGD